MQHRHVVPFAVLLLTLLVPEIVAAFTALGIPDDNLFGAKAQVLGGAQPADGKANIQGTGKDNADKGLAVKASVQFGEKPATPTVTRGQGKPSPIVGASTFDIDNDGWEDLFGL